MRKSFSNFLLLTLGVAVGATALIMGMFELIGNYTYLILVGLFFTSAVTLTFKKLN